MRRYEEAERYYDLVISLAPDDNLGYVYKAGLYRSDLGNLQKAREVLESVPRACSSGKSVQWEWFALEVYERDYEAAFQRLESGVFDDPIVGQQAKEPLILRKAAILAYMGQKEQAYAAFDSARVTLEQWLEKAPDDHRIHAALGRACAGIGQREAAVEYGRRAVDLIPVSKDAIAGPVFVENLAGIYAAVGDYEAALDELEYLMSIPYYRSVVALRLSPRWDPLREHPRFQALLGKGHEVF